MIDETKFLKHIYIYNHVAIVAHLSQSSQFHILLIYCLQNSKQRIIQKHTKDLVISRNILIHLYMQKKDKYHILFKIRSMS